MRVFIVWVTHKTQIFQYAKPIEASICGHSKMRFFPLLLSPVMLSSVHLVRKRIGQAAAAAATIFTVFSLISVCRFIYLFIMTLGIVYKNRALCALPMTLKKMTRAQVLAQANIRRAKWSQVKSNKNRQTENASERERERGTERHTNV